MDYQNIHLTARDCYAPYGTPAEDVLVHPLLFAQRLVVVRAARQMDPVQRTAELVAVMAFRGSPGSAEQPALYRITQAQRAEWTREPRVQVHYRKLKYVSGKPPQEKGIDVLVALSLVEAAESGDYDVVVLAAHDTDLEPALDFAARKNGAKIETAGWDGSRRLRVPGRSFWHTKLTGGDLVHSRDRKDYSVYATP
jgi:uncharacterized LabA/DUF88 family protein